MDDEQEHKERPRPRVIDKRVSARGTDSVPVAPAAVPAPGGDTEHAAPTQIDANPSDSASRTSPPTGGTTASAPSSGAAPATPVVEDAGEASPAPAQGAGGPQEVWTPEQEAEMRAVARQIVETPSFDWVVNTAVTLANVAGTKLDAGAVADAQLAIDGLAALVNGLGSKLGSAETPLRQTLAQLQMAYAQMVAPPPVT